MNTRIVVGRPVFTDEPITICDLDATIEIKANLRSTGDIYVLGKNVIISKGVHVKSETGLVNVNGLQNKELRGKAQIEVPR